MTSSRARDGTLPEGFAEDAWLALALMGTFAACEWYEERSKNAPSPKGKTRS